MAKKSLHARTAGAKQVRPRLGGLDGTWGTRSEPQETSASRAPHGAASQHQGFGRRLLACAEEMARQRGYRKMAVISGVGTRQYYRKHGYEIARDSEGEFMVKPLPGAALWLWSHLLTLLSHIASMMLWLVSAPSLRKN